MRRIKVGAAAEALGLTLCMSQSAWPGEVWWSAILVLLGFEDPDSPLAMRLRVELMSMARSDPDALFAAWKAWRSSSDADLGRGNDVLEMSLRVAHELKTAHRPELVRAVVADLEGIAEMHEDFSEAIRMLLGT